MKGHYRDSVGMLRRFLTFLKPQWPAGLAGGALMVLSALLQLPIPLVTKHLVDVIVPARDLAALDALVILLLGALALNQAVQYVQSRILIAARNRTEGSLRNQLFAKLLRVRQDIVEREKVGYLHARIDSDVEAVGKLFVEALLGAMVDLLTFAVGALLLLYLNPWLAIVSLLSLPVFVLCFHAFSQKINDLSASRQEAWAALRGTEVELLGQGRAIRAFNRPGEALDRFRTGLSDALESNRRMAITGVVSGIAVGFTGMALPFFILWYGIREIIQGHFTLGGFIAFNGCIGYLYGPVQKLVSLNLDVQAALASARRIFEILDLPEESASFGAGLLPGVERVAVDGVSYVYDAGEGRGVRDVSFVLERGRSLAVVGETGKGKSTLAHLLLGLYTPTGGRISINGVDYTKLSLENLRAQVGYVPQEPELLSGSILDNITFFRPDGDPAHIQQLVRWCELEATLRRFPRGLGTDVLEAGGGLSGGEKQRIAIARALFGRPGLLIFDEATSALDVETESRLVPRLLDLPWRPATLFITHRDSFLNRVDQVIRLS